jgi:hypothetical protein
MNPVMLVALVGQTIYEDEMCDKMVVARTRHAALISWLK